MLELASFERKKLQIMPTDSYRRKCPAFVLINEDFYFSEVFKTLATVTQK